MIPLPKLDDRKWEDLVHEAVELIPKYCPEWTNHNASDPGITLLELFAWLIEVLLYRLNRVGDKNYLAFLNLVGIDLQPPQPARTHLTFSLVSGARNFQVVPAGTSVATSYKSDNAPIVFETTRDLVVLPTSIVRCFAQFHDSYADNTPYIYGRPGQSFEAFMGCQRIERYLYFMDPRLEVMSEEALLIIGVETPNSPDTDFPTLCEWEYWNGHRWRELEPSTQELPIGWVAFQGVDQMKDTVVNDVKGYWIRARLVNVPQSTDMTLVERLKMRIEILGEGVTPDKVISKTADDDYIAVDMSKSFFPFHKEPAADSCFYIGNDDLFAQKKARIRLDFELADAIAVSGLNPSNDLQVAWEYYDGRQWQRIGVVSPKGVEESLKGIEFDDSTYCFTRNGTVSFSVPENMAVTQVGDMESYFVRARILQGDYGVPGMYMLDGDKWTWFDERPLRPPQLKSMRLKYEEASQTPELVLTYNDFRYEDITDAVSKDLTTVQVFEPIPDESPSMYFGMNGPFPNEEVQIYFHVVTRTGAKIDRTAGDEKFLRNYYRKMQESYYGNRKLVWEYWNGHDWGELNVDDSTLAFTESGYLRLLGPKDMAPTRKFGENLFWLRVRLEMGGYEELPSIDHILFNTVEAVNRRTLNFEIIGTGRGTPNQTFKFLNAPVLEGEEIWVREKDKPRDEEMAALKELYGSKPFIEEDKRVGGYWVRWENVESFYLSNDRSRHYRLDRLTGTIRFGDGKRGMVVPLLDQNIRTSHYSVGGGVKGNIGPNQATTIRQAIAYIDGVTNYYPGEGGSDVETIDSVKARGPYVIKSRYRAVTQEDFEVLSLQSSNAIARTCCLTESEGVVCIIVVPKFDESREEYDKKLVPTSELLRRVKTYLDERRLVTVRVNVERPQYTELSINLEIIRTATGSSERLKRDVVRALRRFLHPIVGGRDGKGWKFGRSVLKVDIFHIVENVEGVDFVDNIQILDEDRGIYVDQIKLSPKGLPFLVDVDITEKTREQRVV